jgi:hypothetical protein
MATGFLWERVAHGGKLLMASTAAGNILRSDQRPTPLVRLATLTPGQRMEAVLRAFD